MQAHPSTATHPTARRAANGQAAHRLAGAGADLVASALELVAGALRARRCSLMVLDEAAGALVLRHAIGLPDEAYRNPTPPRQSVAARVARTQAPLLVPDVSQRPDLPRSAAATYRTPSFVSVPVTDAGATYGVLNVADREDGGPFTAADLDLLVSLARHLAVCLQNERLQLEAETYAALVRGLKERLLDEQEEERARIARELHDEAGQALASATFRLDRAAESLADDRERARALLAEARQALLECGAQLHRVCLNLRPRLLEELGLVPALRSLLDQFAGRPPALRLDVAGRERRLGPALELTLFRLVQEAVTNVVRHARASQAEVLVAFEPEAVRLRIWDDGVGFDPLTAWAPDGGRPRMGIVGMLERVHLHQGDLKVLSAPGQGTTLEIWLPEGGSAR